ncbi:MAG: basic amino acid ABC transporter substrate-binding protein [Phascolarctobacterium sp.]|nr:basic amino acid ABC transporter substrate-binding protein [Phascolarctobacterium sp.]
MKKLFVLALLGIMAFATFTCSAAQKVLRVGTEPTFAPFEFTNEQGEFVGFDMDLIRAMGKEAGYKVEIQNIGFDGLIPAVQSNIIDCAASGMTITEARSKVVTFSNPYYTAGLLVMVRKDNKDIKSYADLKGKNIACQIGTTGENKSRAAGGKSVTAYNTNVEACMEVVNGTADAVINDAPVVAFYLKTPAGKNCKSVGDILEAEEYGFAFNKNNVQLIKDMNKALATLKKNGEYDKLYAKWFN